jgi:hypothetical protein
MSTELKRVIWRWLPGVFAGIVPLLIFLVVASQLSAPSPVAAAAMTRHFHAELVGHLLIFGIVTCTVSIVASFPRLFSFSNEGDPIGMASLGLVMLITFIMALSLVLYALLEARVTDGHSQAAGWLIVGSAVVTSFYIEVAIANLRLSNPTRRRN